MERYGNLVVFPEHGRLVAQLTGTAKQQCQLWPSLARQDTTTESWVELPWTEETCRLLYNCGMREALEATPFMLDQHPLVEGKYNPLRHQALTAAFITLFPRCYVLSEPRMGKTGSVVLAFDYLQRRRMMTGAVCIITTYTTMRSVWAQSIKDTLPSAEVVMIHGATRKKTLEECPHFFVTNYDSVRLEERAFLRAMDEGRIGAVVVDELTHVGNPTTQRSKAITRMCRHPRAQYVVGLTGSPADNPDAVFGMGKCINPGRLPVTTKRGWENTIYNWWGLQAWQKTLKLEAGSIINSALQPALRFCKADVLDLPPVTEQRRWTTLSSEQRRLFETLQQEAVAILESGEVVTAANGGVLIQRLLQVAQGILKDSDGKTHLIPHKERTQVMLDAIAETPNKVVIFSPYVAGCHMLADECREAGYTVDVITGSVNGVKRAEILTAFQQAKDPHILVCHPITVGFGTELSAADTMIFSVPLLLGGFVYNQALERLSSVKQKSKNINIIHILACQAERKVLDQLQHGHSSGKVIAALFEDLSQNRGIV